MPGPQVPSWSWSSRRSRRRASAVAAPRRRKFPCWKTGRAAPAHSRKATALHGVGHHHARRLRREPVVHQSQHERLCAAAGTSGAGQPRVINFRQCLEKIQRTNTVPCLQTHQVDPPELAHQIVGVRAVVTGLLGVIVAEHVVGECHHAALGEVNAPRRHTAFLAIDQPPLRPVAVQVENRRHFAVGLQLGPVKIAVEVIARVSLDRNIFHRVIAAINRPVITGLSGVRFGIG